MIILRRFDDPDAYRGGYLSIGNFDGVHRGHQSMLGRLCEYSRQRGVPAVVLTFDPHPIALLSPEQTPPRLSTFERKAELIETCGVDCLIAYPTSRELLNLAPEEFFSRIVVNELAACGLVEGINFFFGRDRAGNVEMLRRLCESAGMTLDVVEPVYDGTRMISSSAIRRALGDGDFETAVRMLGNPYRLTGRVTPGSRRGRELGVPTANLTQIATLIPADGVYAGTATVEGARYAAAMHIGPNRTFGEQERKVEVHLLGFAGDLYGHELSVDLKAFVRPSVPFSGRDELAAQLQEDLSRVAQLADGDV